MLHGTTTLITHVGDPIAPVKSPMIYNPWFEQAGIDAAVVPLGISADVRRMKSSRDRCSSDPRPACAERRAFLMNCS